MSTAQTAAGLISAAMLGGSAGPGAAGAETGSQTGGQTRNQPGSATTNGAGQSDVQRTGSARTADGPANGATAGVAGSAGSFAAAAAAISGAASGVAGAGGTLGATQQPTGGPGSPVAVADQVVKHLGSLRTLRDGTHRTILHLTPENLGAVTLTVDVHQGRVRLGVTGAEATLGTLRDGLGQLRDQLGQAGLGLDDVSMRPTAGDPGRGGGQGNPASSAFSGAAGGGGATAGDGGGGRDGANGRPGQQSNGWTPDSPPGTASGPLPTDGIAGAGAPWLRGTRVDVRM